MRFKLPSRCQKKETVNIVLHSVSIFSLKTFCKNLIEIAHLLFYRVTMFGIFLYEDMSTEQLSDICSVKSTTFVLYKS